MVGIRWRRNCLGFNSIDPDLDLLYIGTGNASPWNYKIRSPGGGDNLFVSSIVTKTRNRRIRLALSDNSWDNWDYTATQHIILADLMIKGELRKVLASSKEWLLLCH